MSYKKKDMAKYHNKVILAFIMFNNSKPDKQ